MPFTKLNIILIWWMWSDSPYHWYGDKNEQRRLGKD